MLEANYDLANLVWALCINTWGVTTHEFGFLPIFQAFFYRVIFRKDGFVKWPDLAPRVCVSCPDWLEVFTLTNQYRVPAFVNGGLIYYVFTLGWKVNARKADWQLVKLNFGIFCMMRTIRWVCTLCPAHKHTIIDGIKRNLARITASFHFPSDSIHSPASCVCDTHTDSDSDSLCHWHCVSVSIIELTVTVSVTLSLSQYLVVVWHSGSVIV